MDADDGQKQGRAVLAGVDNAVRSRVTWPRLERDLRLGSLRGGKLGGDRRAGDLGRRLGRADHGAGLPEDLPAAVVVAQHLGGQGSTLVEILARRIPLPVEWARDGGRLERGRITVCPPRCVLEVLPDRSCAVRKSSGALEERPLDALLRSIGDSFGAAAVGVVLTGMGTDGAAGTAALKAARWDRDRAERGDGGAADDAARRGGGRRRPRAPTPRDRADRERRGHRRAAAPERGAGGDPRSVRRHGRSRATRGRDRLVVHPARARAEVVTGAAQQRATDDRRTPSVRPPLGPRVHPLFQRCRHPEPRRPLRRGTRAAGGSRVPRERRRHQTEARQGDGRRRRAPARGEDSARL